ncbi:MAG: MASE1 domain-containing protein [Acidobacteria bacterium]|nr:MASE1 domain-containing protein [Acidobacteriota bacterium]
MARETRNPYGLVQLIGLNLAIAAVYVFGKFIGKAPVHGGFSPLWPPTGIALAALVLFGKEARGGVALGCLTSLLTSGLGPWPSLGLAAANYLEAEMGAWVLWRGGFRPTLARQRDVLLLVIPAAASGALVGATLGCISLAIASGHGFGPAFKGWWSWCMEDLLGVLVVAPTIFTLASRQRARDRSPFRRPWELAMVLAAIGILGYFVFGGSLGDPALQFSLTYALFPLVLVAAERHGPRGASLAIFCSAASALLAGRYASGSLARTGTREYVILLAGFLALLALTALLLSAASEERRERSRNLRGQARLMELATESIGMSGPGGRLLQLNAAGRVLFGLGEAQSLSGLRVTDFVAPGERSRFLRTILPQVFRRGSWSGDLAVRNIATGESIPTRHFLFRIDDPVDGRAESFGAIGHDLRETLRSEAALRQTQRLESLGVLAGGIAHDYNNLLTAVMGHLDLARELAGPGHEASTHLEAAITLAERSGALTRQLLAYAGKGGSGREPIDPGALVRGIAELLHTSLSRKAELVFDIPSGLSKIQGDAVQLEQVVMNLLVNASEALEDRTGQVRLSLREVELAAQDLARRFAGFELKPGRFVALSVADTGAGMGPGVLERIFDPFFSTKDLGRGLGLSAMRGILQAHDGGVEVQSTPGKGTTFTLVFPALEG